MRNFGYPRFRNLALRSLKGWDRGVIFAGEPGMTILPDAVRAYEQELLQKADMLAMGLKGLKSASPERAAEVLAEISSRLSRAVAAEPGIATEDRGRDPRRAAPPVVIAARGGGADDIEDFILDILAENPL